MRTVLPLLENVLVFDGASFIGMHEVVVTAGRIERVGPPIPYSGRGLDASGKVVLPGFIDCHVHLAFFPMGDVLRRGVTTVRDLGWSPAALQSMISVSDRPALFYAGPILTPPGGYPSRAAWAPPGTAREVDGIAGAHDSVRELAEAGARVIKVAQEPGQGPTLGFEVLEAICDEAHRQKLTVTSHVSSLDELLLGIDAGIDELAHGLWSDEHIPDDVIARMVERGIVVVPTLHIDPSPARVDNMRRFMAAGGRVVYGTDMGNQPVPGGIDPDEIRLMVEAGMTVEQALRAATADAAGHLGLLDRGRIEPGMRADLIVLHGDPRDDLRFLAEPWLVYKAGLPIL